MTPKEAIEKAIKHFECVRDDAQVVLDSGFGTHKGESDLVYRNRKMYAELAIEALEKQISKKPKNIFNHYIGEDYDYSTANCSNCNNIFSFDEDYMPLYCDKCGQKFDFEELE